MGDADSTRLEPIGAHTVKGISDPLDLYLVR